MEHTGHNRNRCALRNQYPYLRMSHFQAGVMENVLVDEVDDDDVDEVEVLLVVVEESSSLLLSSELSVDVGVAAVPVVVVVGVSVFVIVDVSVLVVVVSVPVVVVVPVAVLVPVVVVLVPLLELSGWITTAVGLQELAARVSLSLSCFDFLDFFFFFFDKEPSDLYLQVLPPS
jgi:hypothetical protein